MTKQVQCSHLMSLRPCKADFILKKNNSWLGYFFPWIFPQWNKRFLILIGDFLFRFKSEEDESPKGIPIPIDSVTLRVEDEVTFVAATFRKNYLFRAESSEQRDRWIHAIQQQKLLSIKQHMGHAKVDSEVDKINKICHRMYTNKMEIDRRLEASEVSNPMLGGI